MRTTCWAPPARRDHSFVRDAYVRPVERIKFSNTSVAEYQASSSSAVVLVNARKKEGGGERERKSAE